MSVKYRPVRASLAESMDALLEFNSFKDLETYLINYWAKPPNRIILSDIKIEHLCFDNRNDWDTFMVTASDNINKNRSAYGFTNGDFTMSAALTSKQQVKVLAQKLRQELPELTQAAAYELIAKKLGFKDWDTLEAHFEKSEDKTE